MRAMNRRAFLSAIAGIAIAPRLRGTPEPSVLVTDEWLDTVMPSHWPLPVAISTRSYTSEGRRQPVFKLFIY